MFARLLLIALTLVGPLPARVCTCAATESVCTDPTCPSAPAPTLGANPPPERKSCGCDHAHHGDAGESDREAAHEGEPVACHPAIGLVHQHPPAHHPTCPATQVRAAPAPAVPAAPAVAAELPLQVAILPEPVPSSPSAAARLDHIRFRAPAPPLFITFLNFRS